MTRMDFSAEMSEPFTLAEPLGRPVPVILTSPHSGRRYPTAFLAASRLDAVTIRRSEDSFVEELFAAGPALGMPLIAATLPRAFCDLNREPWELDPEMFEDRLPEHVNVTSPRVAVGLGTIARIVATGESIYHHKLTFAEAEARIRCCWQPFHIMLQHRIDDMLAAFGVCLVIDCHSMPRALSEGRNNALPDIVLGDGYGTACAARVTAFVTASLERLGFKVGRNDPYAGGYITRHYGQPQKNVHVLQVEVARSLYMNEWRVQKAAGFPVLTKQLGEFLAQLAEAAPLLLPNSQAWAAASAAE
jgi:N-formylglutamate deformylase